MSVVVRMEMPKSCPCEFAGGYDIPLPCFAGHGIPKRCKEFDECVENGTKPDWCPFVCALPEGHGRLIDADAFEKDVSDALVYGLREIPSEEGKQIFHVLMQEVLDNVKKRETIVPAERSET